MSGPASGSSGPGAAGELRSTLHGHAAAHPDRVAVRTSPVGGDTLTWRELSGLVDRVAAGTGRLTGRPGPVVMLLDNTPTSVAVLLGLMAGGADLLLVEADNSHLADEGSAVHRAAPAAVVAPPGRRSAGPPGVPAYHYHDLTGPGPQAPAPVRADPAILQLTSGSTGEPRITRQTLSAALRGAHAYRQVYRVGAADTSLVTVPVAHAFGLICGVCTALTAGATLVTVPRFTVRAVIDALRSGATVLVATPLGYELLAAALPAGAAPPQLRLALSSGSPLPERVRARATAALGRPPHQIYGSTEAGLIACQYDRARPWPPESVGVAGPGVRWRIRPQEPGGSEGSLLVSTPAMFHGYLDGAPAALDADGFLDTGDIARVDEDGHLFLIARKSTFVNVGGRKVNPRRIERIAEEHPGVREIAVYGVGGIDREEQIHAAVVLADGTEADDLLAHFRTRLMPYEVPRHVHRHDRLPRTGLGKVDRRKLIESDTHQATRG
ncbi:class I adenylate-forming enzyme family protein [Marinactinospora rubrisoli]|uniref:Class I adenylate-forming enzyme family protein n=1 Tax=Marinactinospora rubrisoli TaxID=2715399 RepID=A0ABW2KF20_9ACTN